MPNWYVGPHKSFDTLVVMLMKDKDQAARKYFKGIPKWHQDNIINLATEFLETGDEAAGVDEGLPPKYMKKFYQRLIKVMTDA